MNQTNFNDSCGEVINPQIRSSDEDEKAYEEEKERPSSEWGIPGNYVQVVHPARTIDQNDGAKITPLDVLNATEHSLNLLVESKTSELNTLGIKSTGPLLGPMELNLDAPCFKPLSSDEVYRRQPRSKRGKPKPWTPPVNSRGNVISNFSFSFFLGIDFEASGITQTEHILQDLSNLVSFDTLPGYLDTGVFSKSSDNWKQWAGEEDCPGIKIFNPFSLPKRPICDGEVWIGIHVPHTTAEFFKYGPFVGVKNGKKSEYHVAIHQESWKAFKYPITPIPSTYQVKQLQGGWVMITSKNSPTFQNNTIVHLTESFPPDRVLAENTRVKPFQTTLSSWRTVLDAVLTEFPHLENKHHKVKLKHIDPTIKGLNDTTLSKNWIEIATVTSFMRQIVGDSIISALIEAGLVDSESYGTQLEYCVAKVTALQTSYQNLSLYQAITVKNWLSLTTPRRYPYRFTLFVVLSFLVILGVTVMGLYLDGHSTASLSLCLVALVFSILIYRIHLSSISVLIEIEKPPPPWRTQPRARTFEVNGDVSAFSHLGKFFSPDSYLKPVGSLITFLEKTYEFETFERSNRTSAVFWALRGFNKTFIQPAECPQSIISAIRRYMKPPQSRPEMAEISQMGARFRSYLRGNDNGTQHVSDSPRMENTWFNKFDWSQTILDNYLETHPEKRTFYLNAFLRFVLGRLLPGSCSAMVKLDETLLGDPNEPEKLSKARMIVNPGPLFASLTAPIAAELTSRLKHILKHRSLEKTVCNFRSLGSLEVHLVWGSGLTPSEINNELQRMLDADADSVWIWAAGDDSLVGLFLQGRWKFIEADFSGYDASQSYIKTKTGLSWGSIDESLRLCERLGMTQETKKHFIKIITNSINFKFQIDRDSYQTFNLKPRYDKENECTYYPLPSGIAVTTLFNTSTTMSAWFHVLSVCPELSDKALKSCFEKLGFKLKFCKFYEDISDVTFLKMTPCKVIKTELAPPYTLGKYVWVPVLGVCLKAGLCKKNPRVIYPNLTDEEILIRYPHDIACGFVSYPGTIFSRAILNTFRNKFFINDNPIRAWGTNSIVDFESEDISTVVVEEKWDARYGVTFDGFTHFLETVLCLNCDINHEIFGIILERDYN